MVWLRVEVTAIHHLPLRAGTAVTPARFFATTRNFCAGFVIFVQERIFVQRLQRRWSGFAPRALLHKRCAENLTNYLPCCYRSALRCESVATSPSGYAGREQITSPSQQALS